MEPQEEDKKLVPKTIDKIPSTYRSIYEKALGALRKNNPDYAIEILAGIIKKQPCFKEAREKLRELEKEKLGRIGGFAKTMANFKVMGPLAKAKSRMKKKPLEAMGFAEQALAIYLDNPSALNVLADAAVNAEADFIARPCVFAK